MQNLLHDCAGARGRIVVTRVDDSSLGLGIEATIGLLLNNLAPGGMLVLLAGDSAVCYHRRPVVHTEPVMVDLTAFSACVRVFVLASTVITREDF